MPPEIDAGPADKRPFGFHPFPLKSAKYTKSTFIKIFSYSIFLSLCVLLVTLCILYFSFKNVVTREIQNQSISLLNQSRSIFNSLHEWIVPSFRQIRSEPAIAALINSREPKRMQISAGIDRLLEVLSAYYLVDSIYLYNRQNGEFFSTINGYEGSECSDLSLPEMLSDIRRFGVYRFIGRKMTYRISKNQWRSDLKTEETINVFTIVVGDMPDQGPAMQGALIVNVSERKIAENFFPAQKGSANVLVVVDRDGKVLTHPDPRLFGADFGGVPYFQKILKSGNSEGIFTDTHEGVRYLVSYTTHPAWGWRFINTIPYGEIFRNLADFLIVAVVVFVLLMLLSVCLSYIGAWRIYSPINRLFQYAVNLKGYGPEAEGAEGRRGADERGRMDDRRGTALGRGLPALLPERLPSKGSTPADSRRVMSDVQYVDRVLKRIIENAGRMSQTIEKSQALMKQEALRVLLLGEPDPEVPEESLVYLEEELGAGPFLIAVLRLDGYHRLAEKFQDEITRFFQALKELLSHLMPVRKAVLLQKDHACVILNLKAPVEDKVFSLEEIKTALASVQETVKRQLGVTFTVGMSDVFQSRGSFHEEYDSCLAATQLRFRHGGNSLILTGDAEKTSEGEYVFPDDKVHVLFQELALGRMARVEQIVDELVSGVKEHGWEDYGFMVQSIAYQTSKYLKKVNHGLKNSAVALRELLSLVKSSETLDELEIRLMETFTLVSEISQKKPGRRLEELARKARDHIERNFQDVTLCTDSIADAMGVSAHYIRLAYKNTYGISLSETINGLRLAYCEDRLANTRLPAKKIYRAAGFGNYSYFFTLFKKNTGLTPNQFRLQRQGGQ